MSLREARPGQEPALIELLSRQPQFNLFAISNLSEGLSGTIQAWVDDAAGGVLVRRGAYWTLDAGPDPARFDFDGVAALIDPLPGVRGLSGRPESVDPLVARLQQYQGTPLAETFAELVKEPAPIPYAGLPRPARPADLEACAAIYAVADDMRRTPEQVREMLPKLWVVEESGRIVCVGYLSGTTRLAVMIGAVFTPPEFRRRGYAATLVHAMSLDVTGSGRTACLFYVNPDAGRIYRRLGYVELGPWRLVRFTHH